MLAPTLNFAFRIPNSEFILPGGMKNIEQRLLYGVEGEYYHLNDEGIYFDGIEPSRRYVGWTAATDAYLERPSVYLNKSNWTANVYLPFREQGEQVTERAAFHPLNQFTFNISPVGSEATALAETWNTYMLPLLCDMSEDIDAELDEAIRMLEEAGLDAYLTEVHQQLTDFRQESEK